ncbi:hypothetical protein [Lysobacter sp. A3-1-A15]|uniref:hypothetical protein n=1 Tax=Novilysobacter viscosus TaxID=3098602 RepID=UPI002EDA9252
MNELTLRDVGPLLLERIQRVADARGWTRQHALMHMLETGLFECEAELASRLTDSDSMALQAAIAAMEVIPDDPGFGRIGRAEPVKPRTQPDQSIRPDMRPDRPVRPPGQDAG